MCVLPSPAVYKSFTNAAQVLTLATSQSHLLTYHLKTKAPFQLLLHFPKEDSLARKLCLQREGCCILSQATPPTRHPSPGSLESLLCDAGLYAIWCGSLNS